MSKDIDARLQTAINGSVQNFQSAKLVSSSFGDFEGYRAINDVASANSANINHDIYETVF